MRLTTCGRCGGTARRAPGGGWEHCSDTALPEMRHAVDPDDSAVSGPDDEDLCTCLPYSAGGDGPEVDCPVHGDPTHPLATTPEPLPAEPNPWIDPDAAAAAVPPPF